MPTKTQTKESYPDWLLESIRWCKPPDNLTVTQCADRYEFKDGVNGLPYNSLHAQYQREIMDAFTDPEIEQIWFQKPTQFGGTRILFNILSYIILQDPEETMIVYPTLELAEYTSKNRIQAMLMSSPVLAEQYLDNDSTDLELHFKSGMVLTLAGANSASSLASRPVCNLIFDEVAKFPTQVGKESSAINLALSRNRTFKGKRKVVGISTPVSKGDEITKRVDGADIIKTFAFTCTSCGSEQEWVFSQLKYHDTDNSNDARESAYYECIHCQARINDAKKADLVRNGYWITEKQNKESKRIVAFKANTLPSPWVSFGEIAQQYQICKDGDDLDLQDFYNSWLGLPWINKVNENKTAVIANRETDLEAGILPRWTQLVTAGIDVQKNCFYWTIRAWGAKFTSQNIAHGQSATWPEVDEIMNHYWMCEDGRRINVNLAAIDSGNDTAEVEELHLMSRGYSILVKGSSHTENMFLPYKISSVSRINSQAYGAKLLIVNTGKYKDRIAERMTRENGPGSWMLYRNCDQEYINHLMSEHKVADKVGGRKVDRWQPKTKGLANHYLDCEVYAFCAAEFMGIGYYQDDITDETTGNQAANNIIQQKSKPVADKSSWINSTGRWI